jgi:predicted RNase H-like HicB family nuclease
MVLPRLFLLFWELIGFVFLRRRRRSFEGGYTAQCLELPAAISEGDTKEDALENIREAIQLVLEVTQEQARSYTEVCKVEVACA